MDFSSESLGNYLFVEFQLLVLDFSCKYYRPIHHISSTTNIVERSFNRAKIDMTDLRKSMTPRNLKIFMFLRSSRHLWDEVVMQKAIIRPEIQNCNY